MLEKNLGKIIAIFTQNRIKILLQLFECRKVTCGCDLVKKIKIPKNLLSYHISFLKESALIEEKKCGQRKNYTLTNKGEEIVKCLTKINKII